MTEKSENSRERVEGASASMEEIVNKIVSEKIGDLDRIIRDIKAMLKDDTTELSDLEIDDILLQLPIYLYEFTDDQELVGMQSDLSVLLYKEKYNNAYSLARGTVGDKASAAELTALAQKIDTLIYDHAYKIIKQKINMAIELLNAVKKIQASRQQKIELGGRFGNRY